MMTSSENRQNKKMSISVIDVMIILAVIACIAGVFVHYRVYEKTHEVMTDDVCMVSVLIKGASLELGEGITLGEQIFFENGEEKFGKAVEVNKNSATVYRKNSNGEMVESIDEELLDIVIRIEASGALYESGFLVNGTEYVASGMEIELYSKNFSENCLVIDVENIQE